MASEDLIRDFQPGQELTNALVAAIVHELQRWRQTQAALPLVLDHADGTGMNAPPLLWFAAVDAIAPFQNATGSAIAAGSIATPTPFTATLLSDAGDGSYGTVHVNTTDFCKHFMGIAIPSGANGWGVWRNGWFYPLTWDGC